MPRLLVFVACERLLINELDQSTSLIGIIDTVTIEVPASVEISPDTFAPQRWYIFTRWLEDILDAEGPAAYEQEVVIRSPQGDVSNTSVIQFVMKDKLHQVYVAVNGLPIGQEGEHVIELSLRKADQDREWEKVATYPVIVKHVQQPLTEENTTQE
ncbi:MAG TPA: hypothetical protein VGD58_06445 [Herpetosiphonaceae bacterium]